MISAVTTLSKISIPQATDQAVVTAAKKTACLSAKFWIRIESGKLPYIAEEGILIKATYKQATELKENTALYWVTNADLEKTKVLVKTMWEAVQCANEIKENLNVLR